MYCTRRKTKQRLHDAGHIAIVGAGFWGEKILTELKNERGDFDHIKIAVFDNGKVGQYLCGHLISRPRMMEDEQYLYVITPDKEEIRSVLYRQLLGLGVRDEDIVVNYPSPYDYHYLRKLDPQDYREAIGDMFLDRYGRQIDWNYPKTYNEIINWEKINVKDERRSKLADKYLVKQWVAEQIGEEFVPNLLGVWDNADEVDLDLLPDRFVLKANNASGNIFVVTDKAKIDRDALRKTMDQWMKINFAYWSLELHYGDIVPRIICEEYVEGIGEELYDYDVYCFGGEPQYIECIKACKKENPTAAFYDKDWNRQEFSYGYPMDNQPAPKPEQLEKMLELSRVLSRDFPHVRVDWYITRDGRILFSEMTFSTWSGLSIFSPEKYDTLFGELILSQNRVKDNWHTFLND